MSDFTFGFIMGTLFTVLGGMIVLIMCEDYYNWRKGWKRETLLPPVNVKKLFAKPVTEPVSVRRKRTAKKTGKPLPRKRKTT